jgi:hypothetical protein
MSPDYHMLAILHLVAAGVRSGRHGPLFEERLGCVPVLCCVEGLLGVAVTSHVTPGALRGVISYCNDGNQHRKTEK